MLKRISFLICFLVSTSFSQFDLFMSNFPPSKLAKQEFDTLLKVSGYNGPKIELMANYNVPNALAISRPRPFWGRDQFGYPGWQYSYDRYILYNPNFFTQVEFATSNRFVGLSILSHEIGHHLCNHTDQVDPYNVFKFNWDKEIEADSCSGYILAKMGATKNDLFIAQKQMFMFNDNYS